MDYENINMIGDSEVRYVLKKPGRNLLFVIGINPSTADDIKPDKTTLNVMGFCNRLGYDGFVLLNVYPLRSTKPINLPPEIDEEIHLKNISFIVKELSNIENPTILIAHGDSILKKKYLRRCFQEIMKKLQEIHSATFIQLGDLTKLGNPRHPLMAPANIEIKQYKPIKPCQL